MNDESPQRLSLRRRSARDAIVIASSGTSAERAETIARELESLGLEVQRVTSATEASKAILELGGRPVMLVDGGVDLDADALAELAHDRRPNVVAVELRLSRFIGASDVSFELEPVDVPWYTRRVTSLGRAPSRRAHGVFAGAQVLSGRDARTFAEHAARLDSCAGALAALVAEGAEVYTLPLRRPAPVSIAV